MPNDGIMALHRRAKHVERQRNEAKLVAQLKRMGYVVMKPKPKSKPKANGASADGD